MKLNERAWAGQIISWIKQSINDGTTLFEEATNDEGIKLASGKTKFPDVLLFIDKISGIVFNGWELKFPDTEADDNEMLENALEKAEKLKSNSFVTWNGTEAIIWKIEDDNYTISGLQKLKVYPKEKDIKNRNDLADRNNYNRHEAKLQKRLNEILHDLEQLYKSGELKQAINISGNFVDAVRAASEIILPQFKGEIIKLKGANAHFRKEFNQWKIYESSTLKILASSSRRPENLIEEEVLAKFTFYNLIGKIIFYLTLSENLSGSLQKLDLKNSKNVKQVLQNYFDAASRIDYQAVYQPYFTDKVDFNKTVNETLFELFNAITEFDFKVLPTDVIGTILENLVPKEEKQKFGQYFTSATLANLVAFPAIQTSNDFVFDPTSGTGTFLSSFYQILNYHGNTNHVQLLNQIWGNDISHFPAILSVINLYKQKIKNQTDNFPRVIRDDYFNLEPKKKIIFPDSNDYTKQIEQPIPMFDAIASNFPFIQQEDIPNDVLTTFFRGKFLAKQKAFLKDSSFKINERSDYFTYCVYNSIRFLKKDGLLSAITSNAWLGKEYGFQFKKFLLDNFHIKYIVRSNAEHWFSDSKVSTIFSVLQHGQSKEPTKFVTINFKLEETFNQENVSTQIKEIEDFYTDIDSCNNPKHSGWTKDKAFSNLFHKSDGSITVSTVSKKQLETSLNEKENWDTYFISADLFGKFDKHLTAIYPNVIDAFRGERTGWNPMFVIPAAEVKSSGVERKFLVPYVKSPTEFDTLEFGGTYNNYLFVCDKTQTELKNNFIGANNWIKKFQNAKNKNGTETIQSACKGHRPFWYSLRPKQASIVTAINPYERFFFSYSETPFTIDQRLVAITVNKKYDVELIAALLNSVVTFLTMEMRGTSRNLGALDLNANYFKMLRVLNPDLLSVKSIKEIKKAFQPLKARAIKTIFEEVKQKDRMNFDKAVLKGFGIDDSILKNLYQILSAAVNDRVSMKER
ncbi:MAG TPA: N-6 DNA methylase [Bacteroidia bacterium]|nr:N-6 DNA methylase [Bacteroidia bacterium]